MVSTTTEMQRKSAAQEAADFAESVPEMVLLLIRHMQPTIQAEGISKHQFFALHMLNSLPSASVSAVAKGLAVTAPAACVTVDQLESAGLVTRQRSAKDHRTVEISLTPKGRKAEARAWNAIERRIADAVAELPPDDLATTVKVFSALNRRLDARTEVGGEKG
jgi:MarR family transcriptional regulator, organic hydroperoxide resistance regulator